MGVKLFYRNYNEILGGRDFQWTGTEMGGGLCYSCISDVYCLCTHTEVALAPEWGAHIHQIEMGFVLLGCGSPGGCERDGDYPGRQLESSRRNMLALLKSLTWDFEFPVSSFYVLRKILKATAERIGPGLTRFGREQMDEF